jgi:osmotically-inducible protein OsmY
MMAIPLIFNQLKMKANKNLLTQVQEALANNREIKNCTDSIYVMLYGGVVILSGSVDSLASKKLAKKIVASVSGITNVIDDLRIETPVRDRLSVQIDWANGTMAFSH